MKVNSNTNLPQETNKSQINSLTLHLQELEKVEQQNLKLAGGKKIKIKAEIKQRLKNQQKTQ